MVRHENFVLKMLNIFFVIIELKKLSSKLYVSWKC